ncbi:MAG: thymidylate kinase [Oscillospiraceae bacterium]|nr:thymidylate kinase [Oscillospiraceae bacterium]
MKTKLIMIEGIPGSGKSTFAQRIADFYNNQGLKTNLYNEGGFHPADLAWNAYIPVEFLNKILASYEKFKDEIDKNIHIEDDCAIIPYTQVKTDDKAFFKEMESYEVYNNRVPFDVFNRLLSKRWSAFSKEAKEKDEVNIFECALLQNQVSELMLFHDADIDMLKTHINAFLQAVADLSPCLIYLSQPNVRETIERVAKQRVFEDGSWIDMVIDYSENTPYGKLRGIKGFEGAVQIIEERKRMELEIIKSMPINTIVLENPDYDWEALWKEVESFLRIL